MNRDVTDESACLHDKLTSDALEMAANASLPSPNQLRELRKRNRAWDFVWLIYSVFFLIQPVQEHTQRGWIEFAVAYAVFLSIYAGLVYAPRKRHQYWMLAALVVLGFAYVPVNQSACGIFVYVAAFLPFITESVAVCAWVIAGVCLGCVAEGLLLHLSPWSWGMIAVVSVAVGAGNMVAAQQKRTGIKLVHAHQQIAELAKVAERERIARDLHDLLGHTLSVIVLKSELAGRFFEIDPSRARTEIGEVEGIARQALKEVREAVTGFRMQGIEAEITNAQRSLASAGIKLTCMSQPPALNPADETVLCLILREAVTNILRHAQATECRMEFSGGPEGAQLTVTDNGRGGIREEGSGLRGMRERVHLLGGSFRLESSQGTTISVHLPAHA